MIERACEQLREWKRSGFESLRVAVNLSPLQFSHKNLGDRIRRVLVETGVEPDSLELELTESALTDDRAATREMIAEIGDSGVRIVIDDFGTGRSSLAQLRSFPIHKLKIDHSFVRELPESADAVAVVGAIVAMAKTLDLRVSAKGVETGGQAAFLEAQGCDELHGFYFSGPVAAYSFGELYRGA